MTDGEAVQALNTAIAVLQTRNIPVQLLESVRDHVVGMIEAKEDQELQHKDDMERWTS